MQHFEFNKNDVPNIEEQIKDAKDTLARIIGFIYNCDTKSGMVLAVSGVLSLILGNSGIINQISNILKNIDKSSWMLETVFIIALLISAYFFFYGVYRLSCTISANLVCSNNYLRTYFVDIAETDVVQYKKSFKEHTRQEILEDLLEQIHVNASVCTKKYRNYNKGLVSIRYAICSFIATICFGFLMF